MLLVGEDNASYNTVKDTLQFCTCAILLNERFHPQFLADDAINF